MQFAKIPQGFARVLPRYMLGLTIFIFFLTLYLRQPQAATYGGVSEALMSPSRQTKR